MTKKLRNKSSFMGNKPKCINQIYICVCVCVYMYIFLSLLPLLLLAPFWFLQLFTVLYIRISLLHVFLITTTNYKLQTFFWQTEAAECDVNDKASTCGTVLIFLSVALVILTLPFSLFVCFKVSANFSNTRHFYDDISSFLVECRWYRNTKEQ